MRVIIIIIAFCIIQKIDAQVYTEILRYSQINPGGTARTIGVSGALGAMGGDFGAISINPATLGDFRKSEFTFTGSWQSNVTDARLERTTEADNVTNYSETKFGLDNLAGVFAKNNRRSNWSTSNFSIGYNKLSNYATDFRYEGQSIGSILSSYVEAADFFAPEELDPFYARPAFDVQAIFGPNQDNLYSVDFDPYEENVSKRQLIQRSGGYNELSIAWAGSYKNKLNIGISLGVPFFRYEEQKLYEEDDKNETIDFFNRLTLEEILTTTGGGVNAKIGITYKLLKSFRLGLAYHSPTKLSMNDEFSTTHFYSFTANGTLSQLDAASPNGSLEYGATTPSRFVFSGGYLFRANDLMGFISADIETVNYASASFDLTKNSSNAADQAQEDLVNEQIDSLLSNGINLRLGAEIAIKKYRLRAGIAINDAPFIADQDIKQNSVSFGAGYRGDGWYTDMGLSYRSTEEGYIPYQSSQGQLVNTKTNLTQLLWTFGFKF